MLAGVEPSVRYEGPRAGYRSAKRPLSIPSGRLVSPRLQQELPTDNVKGLDRRKIPTSSQRPTRGTNVSIVYARVASTRSFEQTQMNIGDVLFVCKSNTVFGAGVDRFSRCATLSDVNEILKAERNRLSDVNPGMVAEYVKAREEMYAAAQETFAYNAADQQMVAVRQNGQMASHDYTASMDRDVDEVKRADIVLQDAKRCKSASAAADVCPEFDWMAVPALSEWRPDGVLIGMEEDATVLTSVIPYAFSDDKLLNVCVNGPCAVRNQKLAKVPQFFDEGVSVGDMLYLCAVAIPRDDHAWEFQILPVTSAQLHEFKRADESVFIGRGGIKGDLNNTVAAWQLGKVVDDKMCKGQHACVLVHVDIKRMTRSTFIRMIFGDDKDQHLIEWMKAKITRPPEPPPELPPDQPEPAPEPAPDPAPDPAPEPPEPAPEPPEPAPDRVVVPVPPKEEPEYTDLPPPPGQRQLPAPPYRLLLLPKPKDLVAAASAASMLYDGDEKKYFNLGLAARSVDSAFATTSGEEEEIAPVTWKWFSANNRRFPDFTNATIATGCQTYTLRTLESRPRAYQSQYAVHALYMTEAGFWRAMDTYVATMGRSVVDYKDNCYLFSLMNDNGLTHALCVELSRKRSGMRFNAHTKAPTERKNEKAQSVRFNLLSFELPPESDGVFSLAELIENLPKFVEMAPGNDQNEKMIYISFSLNLLFDLPVSTLWFIADSVFTRQADDRDLWAPSSSARSDLLTDVVLNSKAMGTDMQSSNYFMLMCCLAIISVGAISPATLKAMQNDTTSPVELESLSSITTKIDSVSEAFSRALVSRPPSFLTTDLALVPYKMPQPEIPERARGIPASNNAMTEMVAQRSTQMFKAGENRTVANQIYGGMTLADIICKSSIVLSATGWVYFALSLG